MVNGDPLNGEEIESPQREAEEEPQSDISPTAIAEENHSVDFAHLKRYHEKLKTLIPPPAYYLISGEAPADTGAVGTSYTLTTSDLYPTAPAPKADNIVIFTTTAASYIGQVTEAQETTVTVTVRQKILGAQAG